jgi:nitrite reductase/ring-hydroxylating ferredoxin subunit
VAAAKDVVEGRGRAVSAGDSTVALFREGDSWHAIDGTCPHQGASLADGTFHEGRVICPLHHWVFDARTGRCPRESHEAVRVFATRCREGWVEVEV